MHRRCDSRRVRVHKRGVRAYDASRGPLPVLSEWWVAGREFPLPTSTNSPMIPTAVRIPNRRVAHHSRSSFPVFLSVLLLVVPLQHRHGRIHRIPDPRPQHLPAAHRAAGDGAPPAGTLRLAHRRLRGFRNCSRSRSASGPNRSSTSAFTRAPRPPSQPQSASRSSRGHATAVPEPGRPVRPAESTAAAAAPGPAQVLGRRPAASTRPAPPPVSPPPDTAGCHAGKARSR